MYNYKAKLNRVVDGDTIDLIIDMGFKITTNQRIRLAFVDRPETFRRKHDSDEYKAGMASKNFVIKRFEENQNEMRIDTLKNTGKYGRFIGIIHLADSETTLNDELVEKGFAKFVEY